MCITCAGNVQFVNGPDGKPTEAILYGTGAQATFQNTAGQVVVVTNNSPGTVSIPIDSNGDPNIPAGSNLSVVGTNPSIPSTPTSSSPGGYGTQYVDCWALDMCIFVDLPLWPLFSPTCPAAIVHISLHSRQAHTTLPAVETKLDCWMTFVKQ